jgi:hypothetical protein
MYLSGIYTLVCQPVPCVAPPPPSPDPGSTSAFLPAFPSPSQSPFPRSSTNEEPAILPANSSFLFPLSSIFLPSETAHPPQLISEQRGVFFESGTCLRRGIASAWACTSISTCMEKRTAVMAGPRREGPTYLFFIVSPTWHPQPSSSPPQVLS